MKKSVNLKKRFDDIRQASAPAVEVTLRLDVVLYQNLRTLAEQANQPFDVWLVAALAQHVDSIWEEMEE